MEKNKIRLGVNIDHIATIRTNRNTDYPSLIDAVNIAEQCGADLITVHLREDRRHIQDQDLFDIRSVAKTLNLEMALTNEMIDICNNLSKQGKCPKGVLHCWSGTPDEMKQFLDLGFYISFSGIVTFPKAYEIHECARIVPSDRYLIETDAPFLAPVPHRGKRNEPAFVESVAKSIASLRSCELKNVADESSRNAEDLFKFDLIN